MAGNHERERVHADEDDCSNQSQGEINREFFRRIKDLEKLAKENAEAIHGNGQGDLWKSSIRFQLNDYADRIKKLESLVGRGVALICTGAVAAVGIIAKIVTGAIGSLLAGKDKP